MGVNLILPFCLILSYVVVTLEIHNSSGGIVGFAFYKGGHKTRRPRKSSWSPDESSRLADLEHSIASDMPEDDHDIEPELTIDRSLGASFSSIEIPSRKSCGDVSVTNLSSPAGSSSRRKRVMEDDSDVSTDIAEDSADLLGDVTEDDTTDVFVDTLKAAEKWECDENRFRNPIGEVLDNITDKEMVERAEEELKRERQEGPSMKELLASLEEPRTTKPDDEWKGLIQQFEIEADTTHCVGCGIRLQSGNPGNQGFVAPAVLTSLKDSDDRPRCQRCASMRSGLIFNDTSVAVGDSASSAARETVAILRNALSLSATRHVTVVYVLDVLDMHFERGLADLITARREKRKADTHFYIALNKVDLLPPHSRRRIIMYVHRFINSKAPELRIKPRHIFLMSSRNGSGVNLFLSVLLDEAYRNRSKVFFVGATNAGKSTFINRLSSFVSDGDAKSVKAPLLSTSVVPGTTLRPLRIDAGPGFELFDTPGIVVNDSFTSYLTANELKVAVPSSLGLTKPLRVGAGHTLLLGQFARIDILEGRPFFFTPYFSKHIQVSVMRTDRLSVYLSKRPFGDTRVFYSRDSWTELSDESRGDPSEMEVHSSIDRTSENATDGLSTIKRYVDVRGIGWEQATADLCFKGLGFITLAGALELSLCVETLSGVGVYMREPLMPFDSIPFARRRILRK
ncbi:Uncharacterized protein YqeH [Babesia sp. Xinjiang]|uniref:Uncharacterized protein YqeH n=1 Tax=Babesia sp. Xinjiang TaxID=462227 RepID=UPI000A2199EF|nr:Uncharacterized protein YqeH [Babesia sp. Xinjiang]XP_028871383.1 Uncharacterized protein YqeH [Babesia sp. Xinjiang]ORM40914.1 Uncharacterized protein YqeH [Babesia sp. Xinjiang]ORM40927.1 Uncharacterized protein YqeH [Babesia sp. Xinjiang]